MTFTSLRFRLETSLSTPRLCLTQISKNVCPLFRVVAY